MIQSQPNIICLIKLMITLPQQFSHFQKNPKIPLFFFGFFVLLIFIAFIQWISVFFIDRIPSIQRNDTITTPIISIGNLPIFGHYHPTVNDLPTTTLPVFLKGTIVILAHPQQSIAIISTPDGKTKDYKIGDKLLGVATIKQVNQDTVIINNDGALEKIPLPIHLLGIS